MWIAKFFKSKSEAEELIRRQSADDPLIRKIFFHQFDMLDSLSKEDIADIVTSAQKISEVTSKKSWWIQFIRGAFKKIDPKTYIKAGFCNFWTNFSELFQIGGLFSYDGHTFVNPFCDFALSLDMKLLPRWTHLGKADLQKALSEIPTDNQRPRKITISSQPTAFEILSLLMGFDPKNLELHSHSELSESSQSFSSVAAAISDLSETTKKSSETSSASVIAETQLNMTPDESLKKRTNVN